MARAKRRFNEPPRVINAAEAAEYIGRSLTWLTQNIDALTAAGFPKSLPFVDGYDREAIDAWIDGLGGKATALPDQKQYEQAWERASNG